jgi:hypothetical protein
VGPAIFQPRSQISHDLPRNLENFGKTMGIQVIQTWLGIRQHLWLWPDFFFEAMNMVVVQWWYTENWLITMMTKPEKADGDSEITWPSKWGPNIELQIVSMTHGAQIYLVSIQLMETIGHISLHWLNGFLMLNCCPGDGLLLKHRFLPRDSDTSSLLSTAVDVAAARFFAE